MGLRVVGLRLGRLDFGSLDESRVLGNLGVRLRGFGEHHGQLFPWIWDHAFHDCCSVLGARDG